MRKRLMWLAMASMAACKSGSSDPVTIGSSGGTSAGGGSTGGPSYTITTVDSITDNNAGLSITATSNGTKLAFGTFAPTGKKAGSTGTKTCQIGDGANNPYSGPINTYDIWYAESTDGVHFTSTIIDTPEYTNQNTSVGVGLDSAGKATVAWYGGLPTDESSGALQCGAALWQTKQGTGTSFGATSTLGDKSQSVGLNDYVVAGTSEASQCQSVCNAAGEYIGLAPSVAVDSTGQPLFVARDIHFGGSNTTDYGQSDVEFMRGIKGDDQFFTVDVARGGGTDNRLVVRSDDTAAVAYKIAPYDLQKQGSPGLWVNVETAINSSTWTVSQVAASENLGGGLGFGVNSSGRFSVAYYDGDTQLLYYAESTDGLQWSAPVKIDTAGSAGQFPSLAIDASGEPAIAYYRCSKTVHATACDPDTDGLRVARRVGGTWSSHDVSAAKGYTDGVNPSITFLNGKEVVVFQNKSFDPGTTTSTVTVQVAIEQ